MIRIFTTNQNGKIEITAKELKELLDESYWEGYRANTSSWTYTSPTITTPYIYCTTGDSTSIKLNDTDNKTITSNTLNIDANNGKTVITSV